MKKSLFKGVSTTHVGIWQSSFQPTCWQIVWQDEKGIYQQQEINELSEIRIQHACQHRHRKHLKLITAILPHNLLQRSIILPTGTNRLEIETQCQLLIEDHLPVPLEDIWFDFMLTPLPENQGIKVDIFAVVKEIARGYLQQYAPLKIDVLDSVSNALLAGFHHIAPTLPPQTLCLYQDEHQSIALLEQRSRTLIKQKQSSLSTLYEDFCQHHGIAPKHVVYHRTHQTESLPKNWQNLSQSIPLIPLGCALWKGEN